MEQKDAKSKVFKNIDDILASKGIERNPVYGDYQDYVEAKEDGLPDRPVEKHGIFSTGSMHVARRRLQSVKDFSKK